MNSSQITVLSISARGDIGGGPEHMYQIVRSRPDTVRSIVALPNEAPYFEIMQDEVGADCTFEVPHRKFSVKAFIKLFKAIKHEQVDVIHSHGKGAGVYSRLLGFTTRTIVLHTYHGLHIGDYGRFKRALYIALEKVFSRLTRFGISVSQGEYDQLVKTNVIAQDKLLLIPNGVSLGQRRERTLAGGPIRIVSACRLDYQKHPERLVRIAAALAKRIDIQLTILGGGPKAEELAALTQELGVSAKIYFAGPVSNPRDYFRKSDVYLSTSRWEGMPLSVLEAMSEGCCPVLSNVVGHVDIVESGKNGYLFSDDGSCIDFLCSDPGRIADFGKAAFISIDEKFSLEQMANRTYSAIVMATREL